METLEALFLAMGVPSAIMGFIGWYLKRTIDKREMQRQKRENNREALMLMMMKSERENTNLCIAIAKAVQRIPDAKCNGDMTAALKRVETANQEEKEFLISHGVQHIFE